MEKPPLGIVPRNIFEENRLYDLVDAVKRYRLVTTPVPVDWFVEIADIAAFLVEHESEVQGRIESEPEDE